ncbi:unnamed protein product [Spodoptera exigua]|nr:unnamed protein product [Spodoptera exigua]
MCVYKSFNPPLFCPALTLSNTLLTYSDVLPAIFISVAVFTMLVMCAFQSTLFCELVTRLLTICFICAIPFIRRLCSCSKPCNFNLFASCWAFFFNLQAREASLFFSFLVLGLILNGSSLTGIISFIILPKPSNSFPIKYNFLGFGVKSFPSPFLALPLCFMPLTLQLGLNTGSVTVFKTCGSSDLFFKISLCPFGPLACTLYCQKNLSFFELLRDCLPSVSSFDSSDERSSYLSLSSSVSTSRSSSSCEKSTVPGLRSPPDRDDADPASAKELVDKRCFLGSRRCQICSMVRWVGAEEES